MSEFLEFQGISKRFGTIQAVESVSLQVKKGEFFSLLGPSGCGKTTMLRLKSLGNFKNIEESAEKKNMEPQITSFSE